MDGNKHEFITASLARSIHLSYSAVPDGVHMYWQNKI